MQSAPYGTWNSSLSAEEAAGASVRFGETSWNEGTLYWLESRPNEKGRTVILRCRPNGAPEEILPAPFSARSKVHEYGGASYLAHGQNVYFSNADDQCLYQTQNGETPQPITQPSDWRFACMSAAPGQSTLSHLFAVGELHSKKNLPTNHLVRVSTQNGKVEILHEGEDFYSDPKISPRGDQIAWISWNHPFMPWDHSSLWLAELDANGTLQNARTIYSRENTAVGQPEWLEDGSLVFLNDSSGYLNLYRWDGKDCTVLFSKTNDFAKPQWSFRNNSYAVLSDNVALLSFCEKGRWQLATGSLQGPSTLKEIAQPYTELDYVSATKGYLACVAGSPTQPECIALLDIEETKWRVLASASSLPQDSLSCPEAIEFETERGQTCHAFFYPPKNPNYTGGAPGELPPLLTICHGGPTGATNTTLDPKIQYWTSRGFAVVDVNYGGSTGYGREYWNRLSGQWGIVDVEDCCRAARYLAEIGKADANRLLIRGKSAGGFTAIAALTFKDTFAAAASYYGVSDILELAKTTHKFESHYDAFLVGPLSEKKDLYRARSPIHFAHQINKPMVFFQGALDKVVPPSQAEALVDAMRKNGVLAIYELLADEAHGFRQKENIRRCLEKELHFYLQALKIPVPGTNASRKANNP